MTFAVSVGGGAANPGCSRQSCRLLLRTGNSARRKSRLERRLQARLPAPPRREVTDQPGHRRSRIERSVTSTNFVAQAVKPVLSCLDVGEDEDNTGLTACAWRLALYDVKWQSQSRSFGQAKISLDIPEVFL